MQWFSNIIMGRKYRKRRKQKRKQRLNRRGTCSCTGTTSENPSGKGSGSQGESRKKSGSIWLKRIILACFIFLFMGGALAFPRCQEYWTAIRAQIDILPDANAKKGSLHGESPREIADGDFWVLINQIPTMEEGSRECSIEYENPADNHYSARISLYLMETGELLGNTRRVDPGNYVETIKLKKKLPAGEYPVRAVLELFQNKKPAGDMSLEISLRVRDGKPEQTDKTKERGTG